MILDIPRFKCLIDKRFVTDFKESGFVEAYCFAVTLLENRPLLFTVHTVHGAVYSRLPIWALYTKECEIKDAFWTFRDTWGAISSIGGVIEHKYLKDYEVECKTGPTSSEWGRYAFTIDYFEGGFSQDPEQHKCSHVIFMKSGAIAAYPNNNLRFFDKHFTDIETLQYRRNSNYYTI